MNRRREIFLVSGIVLIAAFFRFYRLNELPPGLHYDEAFNATMAQRVLAGIERPIYFTEDLTEEPLAIYTASIFFWLFGASPFSIRLVSAFVGILTVAALYFCARSLTTISSPVLRERGAGVRALAAFVLAILYWHINFSRLGMEPIFLPLTLTLGMGFLLRALLFPPLQRGGGLGWGRWGFAGLFLALTFYTYKAALFVPVLISAFLAFEIIFNRAFVKQNSRGLAIFLAVAVLAFAPLGLYWATHPREFIERPATVLVTPATLVENTIRVSAMFFVRGDDNPRSNLPGRAALDPFLAIGFVVGIVVCLVRFKRVESRAMLIWLAAMVLPSIVTDFAPHFGRAIAATPAIALITAHGFDAILVRVKDLGRVIARRRTLPTKQSPEMLRNRFARNDTVANASPLRFFAFGFLLFALIFSTFSTFNDYFAVWGSRTGNFDSFDVGLLSLAQKLRARPANEILFLTPLERDHYTVRFGLQDADASSFDGSYALVLPEPGSAAAYGIVTRNDPRTLPRLRKIFPTGRVVDTIYDFTAQPYAAIFRVEGSGQWTPQNRVSARLGENIALLGYDIARGADNVALTIDWGSVAETRADYTVFVHLLDASGRVIAQDDAQPGHRSYPTSRWRAGQVIADDYRLTIPPDAHGDLKIEFGMYILETGARLRVTDANGAPMENDRVLIERFANP